MASVPITTDNAWDEDLEAYWRLDEGASITAYDATGNGYTGTVTNAVYSDNTPEGIQFENLHSLIFNGTDSSVGTLYNPNFTVGNSFTWLVWFKTDTEQVGRGVFSARDNTKTGNPLAEIYLTATEVQGLFRGSDGVRKDLRYAVDYTNNTWHHVAVVINDGEGVLYFDSEVRDTFSGLNMNINLSDSPLAIGAANYENSIQRRFSGFIDDVRVYHQALTSDEISRLYLGFETPEIPPDDTPPVITNINIPTVTPSSAVIAWNTDENASARIAYSVDYSYASITPEINISPRVTNHSQSLSDLLACTIYRYRVVSTDAAGNTATSTSNTFLTTGCSGGAVPSSSISNPVAIDEETTTSQTDSGRIISVTTPENFTTESSIVIQIKGLDANTVLNSIGKPSGSLSSAAAVVFDVKALIDNVTELDSFDIPVTVSYTYTSEDIQGLDKNTLSMYHYKNGTWYKLDSCSVNINTNTITCTAPHFSIFAIFGTKLQEFVQENRASSITSFVGRIRNMLTMHNVSGAIALIKDNMNIANLYVTEIVELLQEYLDNHINIEPSVVITNNSDLIVRDLKHGMEGEDVRKLQNFLIDKGYNIPAGATGYFANQTQSALIAYQSANNISPNMGYFGPITRAFIKTEGFTELW